MAWRLSTGLRNAMLGLASGDGSLRTILANGQIRIFSGTQPADGDTAEQGSLLCTITDGGAAMSSGVDTNGINLGVAAGGVIGADGDEDWEGENVATGTAGWFRWYPNDFDSQMGAATGGNRIRIDGACGVGSGELRLSATSLTVGADTKIASVSLTLPTL